MIKASELLVEVNKLMEEYPEKVGNCSYVSNHEPGCIVGVALNKLGVEVPTLITFDGQVNSSIDVIAKRFPDDIDADDPQAIKALKYIQKRQDQGFSWGKCAPDEIFI